LEGFIESLPSIDEEADGTAWIHTLWNNICAAVREVNLIIETIQLTKNITFKKEPIIISLDFTNLYLNINPIHATKSITDLMHKKLNNKHLNIIALYNILLLMFSTN
jgi:hypothetical protein